MGDGVSRRQSRTIYETIGGRFVLDALGIWKKQKDLIYGKGTYSIQDIQEMGTPGCYVVLLLGTAGT